MPPQSFLNPTILGRPLFPSMVRIRRALSGLGDSAQQTLSDPSIPPTMMAGAAGANPFRVTSAPPLVNTRRFSGPPSERPDWRDPAQQWDARPITPYSPETVGSGETIPVQDAIAQNNANMTDYERGAYGFLSLSPSSAGVVRSVSQAPSTGIAGGTMEGLPSVASQFPSQQYRDPMAPVTADISGLRERVGVRTAYGMVYPTRDQQAAANRLAQLKQMSSRLAEAGKGTVRAKVLKSRIDYVKNIPTSDDGSAMGKALEGLNQAEKIRVMRERGRQLAQGRKLETEEFFNVAKAQRDETFRQKEEKRIFREAKINNPSGGQSRQRSWSNYTGDNPVANFEYEDEATNNLAQSKRRKGQPA